MPPDSATHWTAAVSYNIAGGGFSGSSSSCAARAKGYDTQTTKYTLIAAIAVPGSLARARQKRHRRLRTYVASVAARARYSSSHRHRCAPPFLRPYTAFCLPRGRHMALRVDGPQILQRLVIVAALSGAACRRSGGWGESLSSRRRCRINDVTSNKKICSQL